MQYVLKRKMSFLIINPNTEYQMTKQIEKSLEGLLGEEIELDVVTNIGGPVSIEGHTDEIISSYYIVKQLTQIQKEYDGYLIACFSAHPSIRVLRELTGKPVVGIAEAACYMASLLGNRFGIVTTSVKWEPMLWEAVQSFGISNKCAGVWSTGLSVVQLHERTTEEIEDQIVLVGRKALAAGAEVICLGCAGMSGLQKRIEEELKIPVVDACKAGLMMLYSICNMDLKTSSVCMYAPNMTRETNGMDSDIAEKIYKNEKWFRKLGV